MKLPTRIQADTLYRFINSNPTYEELKELCELDNYMKSLIDRKIIHLELFENIDSEDHPEVNELMDNREIIRDKILVIMRRQFAANHPIQQVFDNPSWTGKVLINSMIDFSDVSNWI
jgi:hypothetical protein